MLIWTDGATQYTKTGCDSVFFKIPGSQNITNIGQTSRTGSLLLRQSILNFSFILIGIIAGESSQRTKTSLYLPVIIMNRNAENNSIAESINYGTLYESYLFHYVDETHLYVDQKTGNWDSESTLVVWGIL